MTLIVDAVDEATLVAGFLAAATQSVDIRVRRKISLTNTRTIVATTNGQPHTVRMFHADPAAEIDMSALVHPTPATYAGKNGVEIYCDKFVLVDLLTTGFDENGSAWKGQNTSASLIQFIRPRARNIGLTAHPTQIPYTDPGFTLSNTIYGQYFAAHGLSAATVSVLGGDFYNVAVNLFEAHPLYFSAKRCIVSGVTFRQCGSLYVGEISAGFNSEVVFSRLNFLEPAIAAYYTGALVKNYAYAIPYNSGLTSFRATDCRFSGAFRLGYTGYFEPLNRVVLECNDYSGCTYEPTLLGLGGGFATYTGIGEKSFAQMQAMGHEVGSTPP